MYYPSSKIKTGQVTSGGELMYANTQEEYKGFYWSTYKGEFFTGKNPNDVPIELLIPINNSPIDVTGTTAVNKIALFINDAEAVGFMEDPNLKINEVQDYTFLARGRTNDDNPRQYPLNIHVTPTMKDYELGEFTRYFLKKENDLKYIELNKDIFDRFTEQDESYVYELFIPFSFPWSLTGNMWKTLKTNSEIVKLQEYKLKSRGLAERLKFNYLQFYLYESKENLYTSGGELVTLEGVEYIGYYHLYPKIGPMIGKTHVSTPHSKLFFIATLGRKFDRIDPRAKVSYKKNKWKKSSY